MAKKTERKKRTGIPKDETPEQRTMRLLTFRLNRAVKDVRQLIPLAGSPYTTKDTQKAFVVDKLKAVVKSVEDAYLHGVTADTGIVIPD